VGNGRQNLCWEHGQNKGFAFVTMPRQAEAKKAISLFNAYSLAEHELKVNVAKPRMERNQAVAWQSPKTSL
jgi:RNA recognition motif-containing protein